MELSNKAVQALINDTKARAELTDALKSGKAAKDLNDAAERLEKATAESVKAAGGIRKIKDADAYYETRTGSADAEAARRITVADDDIRAKRGELDRREAVLAAREEAAAELERKNAQKERDLQAKSDQLDAARKAHLDEVGKFGREVQDHAAKVAAHERAVAEFNARRERIRQAEETV